MEALMLGVFEGCKSPVGVGTRNEMGACNIA